jgi:hypothetical protein
MLGTAVVKSVRDNLLIKSGQTLRHQCGSRLYPSKTPGRTSLDDIGTFAHQ